MWQKTHWDLVNNIDPFLYSYDNVSSKNYSGSSELTRDNKYGTVYETFDEIANAISRGNKYITHNHGPKDVYILKLVENKYYVGSTTNLEERMKYHGTHAGSKWTIKYEPVEGGLIQVFKNVPREFEDEVTVACSRLFGPENVRGGQWWDPDGEKPPVG